MASGNPTFEAEGFGSPVWTAVDMLGTLADAAARGNPASKVLGYQIRHDGSIRARVRSGGGEVSIYVMDAYGRNPRRVE
jgi:hypothetical protein